MMPMTKIAETTTAVMLNGEPLHTGARTLSELLVEAGYGTAKIATALNGVFVAESRRGQTPVAPGDHGEVVAPRQGG